MSPDVSALKIEVNGIVQGVGFRPFVYQLARQNDLRGEVANTSTGVIILVEGPADALADFRHELTRRKPPLAHITEVATEQMPVRGLADFAIRASQAQDTRTTLISPDVSICADCRRELFDPDDRRYRYPFINCTNCGPRYTIIDDIPYDRPQTSMRRFTMCAPCQTEYDDPLNRRFHAQPNACADCGPSVWLTDNRQNRIRTLDPIAHTIEVLRAGHIVAIKGLGGFHLAVDATNAGAVNKLRQRKHREEKPLALMSREVSRIYKYAIVSPAEEALLKTPQRPIVLLAKRSPSLIAAPVSPRNRFFGVMLPYTPLHYLLLEDDDLLALVMTSGNLSEEPIAIDNTEAFERLAAIADYFLMHDRDILLRSDDSIVRIAADSPRMLRRSRGYVPVPVFLRRKLPVILACGAELKNTVCITRGEQAFVSQHIGDLENLTTLGFFEEVITHMQRILAVRPELMAHDQHPDYLSTRYAHEQDALPTVAVQHHHAHIVSAMAENRITGPVIGLAFDGTGYGSDGHIWGGEVLVADEVAFERRAHLDYVAMPGSAAAIKAPWRMAIAYLHRIYGDDWTAVDLPLCRRITSEQKDTVTAMINKKLNTPLTSSLGRLFDAVAALLDLRMHVAYEGQAAMELEMAAAADDSKIYDFRWTGDDVLAIDPDPIIEAVVADYQNKISPAIVSARFHRTLVALFIDVCRHLRSVTSLERVVLSGGVFQNQMLLEGLSQGLGQAGFKVFSHNLVPTNDGGIALGQAVAAAAISKTGRI
jgi:hydrogenase maturation protein HypF